jgi:hypothetical protein
LIPLLNRDIGAHLAKRPRNSAILVLWTVSGYEGPVSVNADDRKRQRDKFRRLNGCWKYKAKCFEA